MKNPFWTSKIKNLDAQIKADIETRDKKLAPNADEVKLAQQASIAVNDGAEARYQAIFEELNKLEEELPRLKIRASGKARDAIKARITYESKFNSITEDKQSKLLQNAFDAMQIAKGERDNVAKVIYKLEGEQTSIEEAWSTAVYCCE